MWLKSISKRYHFGPTSIVCDLNLISKQHLLAVPTNWSKLIYHRPIYRHPTTMQSHLSQALKPWSAKNIGNPTKLNPSLRLKAAPMDFSFCVMGRRCRLRCNSCLWDARNLHPNCGSKRLSVKSPAKTDGLKYILLSELLSLNCAYVVNFEVLALSKSYTIENCQGLRPELQQVRQANVHMHIFNAFTQPWLLVRLWPIDPLCTLRSRRST